MIRPISRFRGGMYWRRRRTTGEEANEHYRSNGVWSNAFGFVVPASGGNTVAYLQLGNKEAVQSIAALLSHPQLSCYARFGLEPNPDP